MCDCALGFFCLYEDEDEELVRLVHNLDSLEIEDADDFRDLASNSPELAVELLLGGFILSLSRSVNVLFSSTVPCLSTSENWMVWPLALEVLIRV